MISNSQQGVQPAPPGGTAKAAGVLALLGGLFWAWTAIHVLLNFKSLSGRLASGAQVPDISGRTPPENPLGQGLWFVIAGSTLAMALLLSGAILLLKRRPTGRLLIAMGCGVVLATGIVVWFGYDHYVTTLYFTFPDPRDSVHGLLAVITLALALNRSTSSWCHASAQGVDRRRTNITLIAGAVSLVAVLAAAVAVPALIRYLKFQPSPQVVLPFTGLSVPDGVAVDGAGNVYVVSSNNEKVFKLVAGSTAPAQLPFPGVVYNSGPGNLAVDTAGNVYVAYGAVMKLAAGTTVPTTLPINCPPRDADAVTCSFAGVAVDTAGDLYVTDAYNNRVLKLAAGSKDPTVLPFAGLRGLGGVAVDNASNVYVTDYDGERSRITGTGGNGRVLKVAVGSNVQTKLPFDGLTFPRGGVSVDRAGAVYVADSGTNRVLKLPAGSNTPTVLPFSGLWQPIAVAVDSAGNVYVTDDGNQRVLELPAG